MVDDIGFVSQTTQLLSKRLDLFEKGPKPLLRKRALYQPGAGTSFASLGGPTNEAGSHEFTQANDFSSLAAHLFLRPARCAASGRRRGRVRRRESRSA
jgi:hypothetical protein